MCKICVKKCFQFLLGIYLWVELLSHGVTLSWTCWETGKWLFQSDCTIYIPTCRDNASIFSITLPRAVIVRQFDNSLFSGHEVVSHCDFDLLFPNYRWCWTSFHALSSHLYMFFGEMSVQTLCSFFHWVILLLLSYKSFKTYMYSGC